jgi:hypothetical protein
MKSYLVSRRLKKEWAAFQQQDSNSADASGNSSTSQRTVDEVSRAKLGTFVKDFCECHKDAFPSFSEGLDEQASETWSSDSLYGDCSPLLLGIVDILPRLAHSKKKSTLSVVVDNRSDPDYAEGKEGAGIGVEELVTGCFSVLDIILFDNKYINIAVSQVINSDGGGPYIVNVLVNAMQKVSSNGAKVVILRIINRIARKNKENRLLIRRIKGFNKIYKLLKVGDDALSEEILRTIKIFLIDRDREAIAGLTEAGLKLPGAHKNSASDKTGSGGITERVVAEIGRLVGWGYHPNNEKAGRSNKATLGNDAVIVKSFPPLEKRLKRVLQEAKQKIENCSTVKNNINNSSEGRAGENIGTDSRKSSQTEQDEQALATLTTVLQKFVRGDGDVKGERAIEVLLTIHMLLLRKAGLHVTFLKIGGYEVLEQLPKWLLSGSPSEPSVERLETFFKILLAMTIDCEYTALGVKAATASTVEQNGWGSSPGGSGARGDQAETKEKAKVDPGGEPPDVFEKEPFLVEDICALQALSNIVDRDKDPRVICFAIRCIYNIVSINPSNVVYVNELCINEKILNILSVPATNFAVGKPGGAGMQRAFELMKETDLLLRYLYVLNGNIDQGILVSYIQILQQSYAYSQREKIINDQFVNYESPMSTATHMNILLEGISGMLSDNHHRGIFANITASPVILEILRFQLRFVRRRLVSKRDDIETVTSADGPPQNETADGTSEEMDDDPEVRARKEVVDIVAKNVLITLEILALLILRDSVEEYDAFHSVQGWRLILDVIQAGNDFNRAMMGIGRTSRRRRGKGITSSTLQQPVSELALWLLREIVLVGSRREEESLESGGGGIPWVVRLLREAWPKTTLDLLQPGTASRNHASSSFSAGAYESLSDEDSDDNDEEDAWAHTGTSSGTSSLRLALLQAVTLLFSTPSVQKTPPLVHMDSAGHTVPLLSLELSAIGRTDSAQVPVGHCSDANVVRKLRCAFCEHGGVLLLLNLSLHEPKSSPEGKSWKRRQMEAKYAFQALGAVLHDCELNKKFIEEEIGFVEFANVLNGSSIVLSERVFDVILDLGIIGDAASADDGGDSISGKKDIGEAAPLSLSLLSTVRRILFPEPLVNKQAGNDHLIASREKSSDENASGSKTGSETNSNKSPERSFSNLSESTLLNPSGSLNPSRRPSYSSALSSSSSTNSGLSHDITRGKSSYDLFEQEDLLTAVDLAIQSKPPKTEDGGAHDLRVGNANTTVKFRSTEAALMPILLLPSASISTQEAVIRRLLRLVDMNPSNCRAFCDMRVPSFILCIVHKIPDEIQQFYLQLVSKLMLYHIGADDVSLLLRLALVESQEAAEILKRAYVKAPQAERPSMEEQTDEVNALVQRREELQMQIYYIIGCAVERSGPSSYFYFDGTEGTIKSASITQFPQMSTGYTANCWLKLDNVIAKQFSFLRLVDKDSESVLEIFFKQATGLKFANANPTASSDDQKYYLCLRTWPSRKVLEHGKKKSSPGTESNFRAVAVQVFQEYPWSCFGDWHHLALTQTKSTVKLHVDGVEVKSNWLYPRRRENDFDAVAKGSPLSTVSAIDNSPQVYYPNVKPKSKMAASKDYPLRLFLGGGKRIEDTRRNPTASPQVQNMLCGQVGTFSVFEGALSLEDIREIYQRGCSQGISSKCSSGTKLNCVFSIDPAKYADDSTGEGIQVWRQGSLSASYADPSAGVTMFFGENNANPKESALGTRRSRHSVQTPPRNIKQGRERSATFTGGSPKFTFSDPALSEFVISASFDDRGGRMGSPARHVFRRRRADTSGSPVRAYRRNRSATDPPVDERRGSAPPSYRKPPLLSLDGSEESSNGDTPKSSIDTSARELSAVFAEMDYSTQQSADIEGSVEAHQTLSFHDVALRDGKVLDMFCGLFDLGATHQIAALRILTGLIQRSKRFFKKFENLPTGKNAKTEHNGVLIVNHLLVKNRSTWSADTFLPLIETVSLAIANEGSSCLRASFSSVLRTVLDMIQEIDIERNPLLFENVVQLLVDSILQHPQGLVYLRNQPYGNSTNASAIFILFEIMLFAHMAEPPRFSPPQIKRSSSGDGQKGIFSFEEQESALSTSTGSVTTETTETVRAKRNTLTSCSRIMVAAFNSGIVNGKNDEYEIDRNEVVAVAQTLGFETDLELFTPDAWLLAKIELSKTVLTFIVDSPVPLGQKAAVAFRQIKPEFPWLTAFQMMACELSETVRVNGIMLLSTLLALPSVEDPLHSKVNKLRSNFEINYGYALMLSILQRFPVTEGVCNALMDLSVERQAPQRAYRSREASSSQDGIGGADSESLELINPGALRVLLNLLKTAAFKQPEMVSASVRTIERMISPDMCGSERAANVAVKNLDTLLACQFEKHPLTWFLDFIAWCETHTFDDPNARWESTEEDRGGGHERRRRSLTPQNSQYYSDDEAAVMSAEAARGEKFGFSSAYSPAFSVSSFDGESLSSFSLGGGSDRNSSPSGSSAALDFFDTIHAIIRRMILHDFCKPWKKAPSILYTQFLHMASSTEWNDDQSYNQVYFVAAVLDDLLDEIDKKPRLPFSPTVHAFATAETVVSSGATTNTLRNLATFLSGVFERLENSTVEHTLACDNLPALISKAVIVIKRITAHNRDERLKMKSTNLFSVRDNLVLHCLSSYRMSQWRIDQRVEAIASVTSAVEIVAVEPNFASMGGMINLIHLFFEILSEGTDSTVIPLQTSVARLLRVALEASDNNRRELVRAIQDQNVLEELLPTLGLASYDYKAVLASQGAWLGSWRKSSGSSSGSAGLFASELTASDVALFIDWFLSYEAREDTINRIAKAIAPIHKACETNRKKNSTKITKYIKNNVSLDARQTSNIEKTVEEMDGKLSAWQVEDSQTFRARFFAEKSNRGKRLEEGKASWAAVSAAVRKTSVDRAGHEPEVDPWENACGNSKVFNQGGAEED